MENLIYKIRKYLYYKKLKKLHFKWVEASVPDISDYSSDTVTRKGLLVDDVLVVSEGNKSQLVVYGQDTSFNKTYNVPGPNSLGYIPKLKEIKY